MPVKLSAFVVAPHKENPDFVGREEVTVRIHEVFKGGREHGEHDQRAFVLCGLGGIGKTSIAVDYVYRHRRDYRVILWAHGETKTKLADSFTAFEAELGFWAPKADHKKALHQWLSQTRMLIQHVWPFQCR